MCVCASEMLENCLIFIVISFVLFGWVLDRSGPHIINLCGGSMRCNAVGMHAPYAVEYAQLCALFLFHAIMFMMML